MRHPILKGNSVFDAARVLHQIEQRSEGFFTHNRKISRNLGHRRRDPTTARVILGADLSVQDLATPKNGAALGRDVFTALANYPFPVLPTAIGQRVAFAESAALGCSVLETAPASPAAQEILALTRDLLERQP